MYMIGSILYIVSLFVPLVGGLWLLILAWRGDPRYKDRKYRHKIIVIMFSVTIFLMLISYFLLKQNP